MVRPSSAPAAAGAEKGTAVAALAGAEAGRMLCWPGQAAAQRLSAGMGLHHAALPGEYHSPPSHRNPSPLQRSPNAQRRANLTNKLPGKARRRRGSYRCLGQEECRVIPPRTRSEPGLLEGQPHHSEAAQAASRVSRMHLPLCAVSSSGLCHSRCPSSPAVLAGLILGTTLQAPAQPGHGPASTSLLTTHRPPRDRSKPGL